MPCKRQAECNTSVPFGLPSTRACFVKDFRLFRAEMGLQLSFLPHPDPNCVRCTRYHLSRLRRNGFLVPALRIAAGRSLQARWACGRNLLQRLSLSSRDSLHLTGAVFVSTNLRKRFVERTIGKIYVFSHLRENGGNEYDFENAFPTNCFPGKHAFREYFGAFFCRVLLRQPDRGRIPQPSSQASLSLLSIVLSACKKKSD